LALVLCQSIIVKCIFLFYLLLVFLLPYRIYGEIKLCITYFSFSTTNGMVALPNDGVECRPVASPHSWGHPSPPFFPLFPSPPLSLPSFPVDSSSPLPFLSLPLPLEVGLLLRLGGLGERSSSPPQRIRAKPCRQTVFGEL